MYTCIRVAESRRPRRGIRATAAKFDSFNEEPKLALRRLVRRQLDIGHSGERQRRCDKNMHNYAQRGRHRFVNNRRPFPLCDSSRCAVLVQALANLEIGPAPRTTVLWHEDFFFSLSLSLFFSFAFEESGHIGEICINRIYWILL